MLYEQFYKNVKKSPDTERVKERKCFVDYFLYKLKNSKKTPKKTGISKVSERDFYSFENILIFLI